MIMLSFVLLICGDLHSQGIQPSSEILFDEYVHILYSSGAYTYRGVSDPAGINSTVRIRTQAVPSDSLTFLFPLSLSKELRAECRNDRIMFTGESAGLWRNVSQGRTIFLRNTAHIICSGNASSCLHTNPYGKSIKEIISSDIPSEKSPVLAGLLSLFLPGTGQAYNGQWIKAGIQWTLLAGSLYMAVADVNFESDGEPLPPLSIAGLALGGATWLWSAIDAPVSANHINKERTRALRKHNLSGGIGITVTF